MSKDQRKRDCPLYIMFTHEERARLDDLARIEDVSLRQLIVKMLNAYVSKPEREKFEEAILRRLEALEAIKS